MISRRRFLETTGLTVTAVALGDLPLPAQGELTTSFEVLRRNVGIFTGQGGTIGWLVNDDGVLAVDSQNAAAAAACVAGLRQRSNHRVDVLVNTHHHGDHTGGNRVFSRVADAIVGHERCAAWHRRTAEDAGTVSAQAFADITFARQWRTRIGDETVVARYHGAGHTSGDVVVTFEQANVAHMGDLVFNRLHPFVDRASGARIVSWLRTLETVVGDHDADTIYVCGHGSPAAGVTATGADLLRLRDYFDAVLSLTRREMQAGRSRDEITATGALEGFDDYVSPFPALSLSGVLGVAYDELAG